MSVIYFDPRGRQRTAWRQRGSRVVGARRLRRHSVRLSVACLVALTAIVAGAPLAVAASAPVVNGVSPAAGPLVGGTVVTVTGANLTGATKVLFGTTAGTALTVLSATQLKVTAPAHPAGVVDILVTTPNGTSAVTTADRYTYVAPPPSGVGKAWGYNGFGNLGVGSLTGSPLPLSISLPAGVRLRSISAGAFHSLAIGSDGKAYAWGRDDSGQLGNDAALAYKVSPVLVATPVGVHFTRVAAGGYHSLALGDDGRVYAWGQDANGALGNDAALANKPTPVRVALPAGVRATAISAGFATSLTIGNNGVTYSWGYDAFGELGNDAARVNRPTPVAVALPAGVHATAISCGGHHSLLLADNGRTYSWGWDDFGQLGDGATLTSHSIPVTVATPAGVRFTRVSAGGRHSLAIGTDGKAYAWGSDLYGQLGNDAALVNRPTPVAVALPVGVYPSILSGGGDHSLVLTSSGAVYAWGLDSDGQLGNDAALVNRPTPVHVVFSTAALAVSAGYYHSLAVVHP